MKKILLILVLFSYLALADEEVEKKIAVCQSVTDPQQRLSCYDTLFQRKTELKANDSPTGNWLVKENVSPIDDSKTITLILDADQPIEARYAQKIPKLIVRCKAAETELYIYFDVFLGSNTLYPITRIDTEKAVSDMKWDISTNHKAIFYNGNTAKNYVTVIDFLTKLQTKNKYFIQITPYGESPVHTTFTLTGLSEAMKPFKDDCGW